MALRVKINPEKIPDRDLPLSIYKLSVTRSDRTVLHEVSLEVTHGEILGILGENGSGKSTFVSTLAGTLDLPKKNVDFHHALHDGKEFMNMNPRDRYNSGVHCVFQGRKLFLDLTVKENLQVAMRTNRAKKIETRVSDVVDLFPKMGDILQLKAKDCTVGQQQIVAIVRAIMEFPSVLILDEPTLGLSPNAIEAVAEVLKVLISGSVGVVVLERRNTFIKDVSDRSLLLHNGRLGEPIAESSRATEWKPQ